MNELFTQFGKLVLSLQTLEENLRAYIFLSHKDATSFPWGKITEFSLSETIAYSREHEILSKRELDDLSKISESRQAVSFALFTEFQGSDGEVEEIKEKIKCLQEDVDRFNASISRFLKAYADETDEWLAKMK